MATTALTPPAYLDALRAALVARAGLAGVAVYTAYVGDDAGRESIQFVQIENASIDWAALGNRRLKEKYDILGFIWIEKPGAGEDAIKASRDRGFALLLEVLDAIRVTPAPTPGTRVSRVSTYDADQPVSGQGFRACRIAFRISVESDITAV